MRSRRTMMIGSLVWALLFILAAYALRGHAAGSWISGMLLVGWCYWFYSRSAKSRRADC